MPGLRRFCLNMPVLQLMTLLITCCASQAMAAESLELVVEGVEGELSANVQQALTLPRDIVREGRVDRLWLERLRRQAEEKARRAIEPFGYYKGKAKAIVEEPDSGEFVLHVSVEPGPPVRLSRVHMAVQGAGAGEETLKDLVEEFPLRQGDVLLQQEYERTKAALQARAQELGYLDADFVQHRIGINRAEEKAEIDLVMETGPRYYFGSAAIQGAEQYPGDFLRRYLAFREGEVFSYGKLGETQVNYTNADRFRQVVVTPEREKASPDHRIPVLVQLEAAPRHTLHPGIGYGTDTGARFSIRYRDRNLWNMAHEFNSNLFISERLQGLHSEYVVPSPRDINTSTSLQLTLQQEDVAAYISRFVAVELGRNHSFGSGRRGTAYVRVQQESFIIGSERSDSRLVLPGYRFTEDRYDSLLRPRKGYRYGFDLRGTHQYLGSDTGLLQLVTDASTFLPLPWRFSLFLRGRGAFTAQNDPLAELPASLRFFAGGDTSVRGYSYRALGPRNAAGEVTGGRHLLTGTAELFRDLFDNWAVSAFYDAGNAFNAFANVAVAQGAGIGIHYYSPIGALNLSLARQLAEPEPALRIHFTLGFEL